MQETKVTPINKEVSEGYKTICNGYGCSEIAIEKIIESVRDFGEIELKLSASRIIKLRSPEKGDDVSI